MKLSEKLAAMVEFHPGQKFPNTTLVPVVAMALQKWAGEAQKLESAVEKLRGALKPFAEMVRYRRKFKADANIVEFVPLAALIHAHDVLEEMKGVGK